MTTSRGAFRTGQHRLQALLLFVLAWMTLSPGALPNLSADSRGDATSPTPTLPALGKLGKTPLRFEANAGQFDPEVRLSARGKGYGLWLTDEGATLSLRASEIVLRFEVEGAAPTSAPAGLERLETKSNYFIGDDPSAWRTDVPNYARANYANVLPGVDLLFHGEEGQLEYDFVVAPGVSPDGIVMNVRGAAGLALTAEGDLEIRTALGPIVQKRPVVYQEGADGARREVHATYRIVDEESVGFVVAAYDRTRTLVIDPVIVYSTYLGGSTYDDARGIAVDAAGNAYVAGYTDSTDFPKKNALQTTHGGGYNDVFVAKLDPTGSAIAYATYIGGNGDDSAFGIAVDAAGNAYVTGYTDSTNFPRKNALQMTKGAGLDAFVTKIDAAGSAIVYSTYLGGNGDEAAHGIAVDAAGGAYVTGYTESTNFPKKDALQATYGGGYNDAFVTKIDAAGSAIVYSTYLGGNDNEFTHGIAVDAAGNAYVAGDTASTNFPTKGALQATYGGGASDAFVTKIDAAGSAIVYSTYLGGASSDAAHGVAVDGAGNAFVAGKTESADFPTKDALQPAKKASSDAFVAKLAPAGSALVYATYLGGTSSDTAQSIKVDGPGAAYVVGYTASTNFPTKTPAQATRGGGTYDAFVAKLAPAGGALVYSTYLGGSDNDYAYGVAVNGSGSAYVAGYTASGNLPTNSAPQATRNGAYDAFVTVLTSPLTVTPETATTAPRGTVTFTVDGGMAPYTWSVSTNPSGGSVSNGVYTAGKAGMVADVVQVTDALGDTATASISVGGGVAITPANPSVSPREEVTFTAIGGSGEGYTWALVTNASGGTIDAATGAYEAGKTDSVTDTVRVTDSLGNTGTTDITVGPKLGITPATATLPSGGTQAFTATGGSNTGFTFALTTNSSGGTVDVSTGVYTAGKAGGVTDAVTVTDSLGNEATATINVTAVGKPDDGVPDDGSPDGGTSKEDDDGEDPVVQNDDAEASNASDDGCGCHVVGASSGDPSVPLGLTSLGLVLTSIARRRRRDATSARDIETERDHAESGRARDSFVRKALRS